MKRRLKTVFPTLLLAFLSIVGILPSSALALEPLQWRTPVNISQSINQSETPLIVDIDTDSKMAIWVEEGMLVYNLQDSGIWGTAITFYAGETPAAVNREDKVYLAWVDQVDNVQDVLYSEWEQGTWSPPVNVSITDGDASAPDIAVSMTGRVHVVWSDDTPGYSSIYHGYSDNGSLWAIGPVPNASGSAPSISLDSAGLVDLAWHDRLLPGDPNHVYNSSWDGNSWTWPIDISDSDYDATFCDLLQDSQGTMHLVWGEIISQVSRIKHCFKEPGEQWTLPENVSPSNSDAWSPRLAMASNGQVVVAWNAVNAIACSQWDTADNEWSTPTTIIEDSLAYNEVAIVGSTNGIFNAVWTGPGTAGQDIYFSTTSPLAEPEFQLFVSIVLR